jgi:hypothetical protein
VGPHLIVQLKPSASDLADLVEITKQIQVKHLLTVAAVEPFDERILIRFARLDVMDEYALAMPPVHKRLT